MTKCHGCNLKIDDVLYLYNIGNGLRYLCKNCVRCESCDRTLCNSEGYWNSRFLIFYTCTECECKHRDFPRWMLIHRDQMTKVNRGYIKPSTQICEDSRHIYEFMKNN
jgi:hypothetical protein